MSCHSPRAFPEASFGLTLPTPFCLVSRSSQPGFNVSVLSLLYNFYLINSIRALVFPFRRRYRVSGRPG